MNSVVRFRTGEGDFAVAVEHVREVRTAVGLKPIPSSGPGVAGMLAVGDQGLTVLSALGQAGGYVLVLEGPGNPFGLLVEEVTGVVSIDERRVGPPPAGHIGALIAGVIAFPNELVLLIDPTPLARVAGGGDAAGPSRR